MNWWFIVYLCMNAISIGMHLVKHGEPKEEEYYNFFGAVFGAGIGITIVYMAIKTGL